ncbi:MAG: ATP-binding protein, partial [Marmoricola sp.]
MSGDGGGHAVEAGRYDASAIQVLEGLEAVRKRPGMYIGSTGERGLHHLVWEVVDNSVDEALAGYCDRVDVVILPGGCVEVRDNGRGIPVDIPPGQELPALTVVLTVLHAGGKFGGGGYKVSGGLHGVGVSVVNALSARVEVEVRRNGFRWSQAFVNGVPEAPLEKHEATDEAGTTTRFWPSPEVFETTNFSFETITNRLREYAFLNKGLEIVVRDARPQVEEAAAAAQDIADDPMQHEGSVETEGGLDDVVRSEGGALERRFKFDRGLVDFVEYLNRTKTSANPSIISFEASTPPSAEEQMSLELAMQWNTTYAESVHTFANTINTHEGGTHEEGFRSALTSLVNHWGEEWGLMKKP